MSRVLLVCGQFGQQTAAAGAANAVPWMWVCMGGWLRPARAAGSGGRLAFVWLLLFSSEASLCVHALLSLLASAHSAHPGLACSCPAILGFTRCIVATSSDELGKTVIRPASAILVTCH